MSFDQIMRQASRRHFLRGMGVALALPWLESLPLVGQTVAASLQAPVIFQIANDLTKMQIDSNVAEADVGVVLVGQDVDFTVDAFPAQTFHGKVVQVRNAPITSPLMRRTVKWPCATCWKWSMKTVLTIAPSTAPMAGIDFAAICSLTCTEKRAAIALSSRRSAAEPCAVTPFVVISEVAFDTA